MTPHQGRTRVVWSTGRSRFCGAFPSGLARRGHQPIGERLRRVRRAANLGALYKLVVCTLAAAAVVAGCGEEVSPNSALPPVTSQPPHDPTLPADALGSAAALDGLVSADEAARASELVRSDDIASELLDRYGGQLTAWEPAELEGEARGAVAMIEFTEPISMSPMILRPEAGNAPTRVEDYVLVTVQLGNETVEQYGVIVDLKTMTIVHLAPRPAPPVTVVPLPD